jgi:PleD family two-component response regulator
VFLGDGTRVDDILKCADNVMYQAKAEGRNKVRFYEAKE